MHDPCPALYSPTYIQRSPFMDASTAAVASSDANKSGTTAAHALIAALSRTVTRTHDDEQMLTLIRRFLACSPSHTHRAKICNDLAHGLWSRWERMSDELALATHIEVQTELLDSSPSGHADRATLCGCLAVLLKLRFEQTGDGATLDRVIELHKEALALRPAGHPERAASCGELAVSLNARFRQTGDVDTLGESIRLLQEALTLRPDGHPDRAGLCNNYAVALHAVFDQTGDLAALDESIKIHTEALVLRPAGHPDRARACNNLASSIGKRFEQTGEGALLDQAIQLEREALALRSVGHPDRAIASNNLARSLVIRFQQTGDSALITEATCLLQDVLAMPHVGYQHRVAASMTLASCLETRSGQSGDPALMLKAVRLYRDARDLLSVENPTRADACSGLATLLRTRFQQTGDRSFMDEALQLSREALAVKNAGYDSQGHSRINFSALLLEYMHRFGIDQKLLAEGSDRIAEALALCPRGHPNRWSCVMQRAKLALLRKDYTAVVCDLNEILRSPSRNVPTLLMQTLPLVTLMSLRVTSTGDRYLLLEAYKSAVELLGLVSGLALDYSTQLQLVNGGAEFGSGAYMLANTLNELETGLWLLEQARGIIWSHTLQLRNPPLSRVPDDLALQMHNLLEEMGLEGAQSSLGSSGPSRRFMLKRDLMHEQRSRLQQILGDIRRRPGLDDFMRGPDGHTLLEAAANNPVVVLIANHIDCHALIMRTSTAPLIDILLDIDAPALHDLTFTSRTSQNRGAPLDDDDIQRAMGISKRMSASYATLAKLWRAVVKPVINFLQLDVSSLSSVSTTAWSDNCLFLEIPGTVKASNPLVSHRRVCVCPRARSRYLSRPQARVLCRLRGFVIHTNLGRAFASPAGLANICNSANQAGDSRS
jgi:hypothetical protein